MPLRTVNNPIRRLRSIEGVNPCTARQKIRNFAKVEDPPPDFFLDGTAPPSGFLARPRRQTPRRSRNAPQHRNILARRSCDRNKNWRLGGYLQTGRCLRVSQPGSSRREEWQGFEDRRDVRLVRSAIRDHDDRRIL